jgi:hypothetical protein
MADRPVLFSAPMVRDAMTGAATDRAAASPMQEREILVSIDL